VIPKSGNRFSEKITLKQKAKSLIAIQLEAIKLYSRTLGVE
jgi:hypothetical protein